MKRTAVYVWAFFPGTLLGLLCVLLAKATGGTCHRVEGCLETSGGAVTWLLKRILLTPGGAAALTLGHVILGQDEASLHRSRLHEHVHVRQYERWGPAFLPAYFLLSGIAWIRRRNPYYDNPFEVEAYEQDRRRRTRLACSPSEENQSAGDA